jgi:hypothetical protein
MEIKGKQMNFVNTLRKDCKENSTFLMKESCITIPENKKSSLWGFF